jgi:hypothetical protein
MTKAADLAGSVCLTTAPTPGIVHDPASPLVLGDQLANNYSIQTFDLAAHKWQLQIVWKPAGSDTVTTSVFSYDSAGVFLINGVSIANLPEIASAVAAAAASASAAQGFANTASTKADQAGASATNAANQASTATAQATLAGQYANATAGTPLPGGGDSAKVSADRAATVAAESRELDIGDDVIADEVFASGFLETERQVKPVAGDEVVITIPPNIYSSPNRRARWASYKLASTTGSIKVVPQAGAAGVLKPQIKARGRTMYRPATAGAAIRNTLSVVIPVPAVTAGELVCAFHALHNGAGNPCTVNFTSVPARTWDVLQAYPAVPRNVSVPDWFVTRTKLTGFAAANITVNFDEGVWSHLQAVDWWVIEGTENGAGDPIIAQSTVITDNDHIATLPAVPAQSLVLATGALGALSTAAAFNGFSANLTTFQSGNTVGLLENVAGFDTTATKNEAWGTADGTATVAGDFAAQIKWTAGGFRGSCLAMAYKPKIVPGAGAVTLNLEGGAGRDVMAVPYGVMELWFRNDGVNVDVRTPTP